MAKTSKTIHTVTDDLTGEDITDRFVEVHFAHNGQEYLLDLSRKNADAFTELLSPYKKVATKIPAARHSPPAGRKGVSRPGIITWAKENGFPNAHGRPGPDIIAAYDAAHGNPA